jgi:hypothetical protein
MKLRNTPLWWRKDWTLHRSKVELDSHGDPVRRYDLTKADYTGQARTASGVAWHIASREAMLREYGDSISASANFLLDLPLAIEEFDRCVFGGTVWEVRSVMERSGFRMVKLVEVGKVER